MIVSATPPNGRGEGQLGSTTTTRKIPKNHYRQKTKQYERISIRKQTGKQSSEQHQPVHRFLLEIAGRPGYMAVSIAVMLGILYLAGLPNGILPTIGILLVVRFIYGFIHTPRSVLPNRIIRKQIWQVIREELAIGFSVAAMVYLTAMDVDRIIILGFVGINGALQIIHFLLIQKPILNYVRSTRLRPCCHRVVIAGTGPRARAVADMLLDSPELDTSIEGFLDYRRKDLWRYRDIPLLGHPEQLGSIIADNQVDAVIMACDRRDIPQTTSLFTTAERMGTPVVVLADMYHPNIAHPVTATLGDISTVTYRAVPESKLQLLFKDIIDRIGAFVGLVLLSPLLLLTAVIIKLESKGPVFFVQKRSGVNGKLFTLYKFRTMCSDAERLKKQLLKQNEMSGPAFKIRNDPRITKVGRILRKYSIDELPQLFNVLRGEMSLVGPRPPLPSEVSKYKQWQHRKLSVKPGLTCLWQVNGRNNIDFENWMRLDLEYIDNWSVWLDTKILAKTIPAVMRADGAS